MKDSVDNVHPFQNENFPANEMSLIQQHLDPLEPNEAIVDIPARPLSSLSFQSFKICIVTLFASASSLSLPIFIILMQQVNNKEIASVEEKILAPLLPYLLLFTARCWLLWNDVGHRLDGHIDADIPAPNDTFADTPAHIRLALFANVSSFMLAFLVVYAGLSKAPVPFRWGGAIIMGGLSYTVDTYTILPSAFRRYTQYKQSQGQSIKPFFKQKNVQFLDKHALLIGKILRECLPIVRGIVWTKITTDVFASTFAPNLSENRMNIVKSLLGIMIYSPAAYLTRFELVQFGNNLAATGKPFVIENTWSRSSHSALRLLGTASNGQMLIDILQKFKLSRRTSVNFVLIWFALSSIAVLLQTLHTYVSSTDDQAMQANEQGLLMNYCIGKEEAIHIAPKTEIVITGVAITLGVVGVFAKSAILHQYARERTARALPHQVVVEEGEHQLNY